MIIANFFKNKKYKKSIPFNIKNQNKENTIVIVNKLSI